MILHEYDYDVAKVIEYLLDGGEDLTMDWKTAGKQSKKQTTSPNQTLEEADLKNGHSQKFNHKHHNQKNDTNGQANNGERNGRANRGDKSNRKFERNPRKIENNENNGILEDKLSGMNLQENDSNHNNHGN